MVQQPLSITRPKQSCIHPFDLLLQASLDQHIDDTKSGFSENESVNVTQVMNVLKSLSENFKEPSSEEYVCHNRECNNPRGYPGKPNSIYCSSRCQSRGNLFLAFV